jgi:hypothetical protein
MHRQLWWTAALALVVASPALAYDHRVDGEERYELKGTTPDGREFTSTLVLRPADSPLGGVVVTRTVDGETQEFVAGLTANTIALDLNAARGAKGRLEQDQGSDGGTLVLTFGEGGTVESVLTRNGAELRAAGKRVAGDDDTQSPDAPEGEDDDSKLEQLGDHLVILAKEELEKASYDGVKLDQRFKLSEYLHVGVGLGVAVLDPNKQTIEQTTSVGKATAPSAWLVTTAEGGARVPLNATIPLGEVTLRLGFHSGAKARYRVVHLYEVPDGFSKDDLKKLADTLKELGKRSFDLPLGAAEAQEMAPGTQYLMEGEATAAFTGSLQVGTEITDFGGGVMRIGASARVGGFYRVRGDLRFEVYRLGASEVRVRVTRGKTKSRGRSADLFLGATVDRNALKETFEPAVDHFDNSIVRRVADAAADAATDAVADGVEKVVKFTISTGRSRAVSDEVDVSYRFDLTKAPAQEAFADAMRGNFVTAGKLRDQAESGVVREYRVLAFEEKHHHASDFALSILASGKWSKDVKIRDLDIQSEGNARTRYELFTFNRHMHLRLIGNKKNEPRRNKDFVIEAVRRTREGLGERSFTFRYRNVDPTTFKGEGERIRRIIDAWGLDATSAIPKPGWSLFRSRYGKTETVLLVEFSEEAVEYLLSKSEMSLFYAYVEGYEAVHGKNPMWADPDVRQLLLETDLGRVSGNRYQGHSVDKLKSAQKSLREATEFMVHMRALAAAGGESDDLSLDVLRLREQEAPNAADLAKTEARLAQLRTERAELLKKLAESGKKGLLGVSALVQLVPKKMIRLRASIAGDRIAVNDSWDGPRNTGPIGVNDPRPPR